MSWSAELWLALLVLPARVALVWWRAGRGNATAADERDGTGPLRVDVIAGRVRERKQSVPRRAWCLLAALALAIIALARPQWGTATDTREEPAREIVVALDLSRSMAVTDVAPTRLACAKQIVRELLGALQGERVALVVFSGTAQTAVPLSSDYQITREFLAMFEAGDLPKGGSDFGEMLRTVSETFSADAAMERTLFVLSDGENTNERWRDALTPLARRGVSIVTLGIGTAVGGAVPAKEEGGVSPARSRLEPSVLLALATGTGGFYRNASAALPLKEILASSLAASARQRQLKMEGGRAERYAWFLVPALLFAALGVCQEIPARVRRRSIVRRAAWSERMTSSAAVVSGVMIAVSVVWSARSWAHEDGHEYGAEVTAAGKLQWLVDDLARHTSISGRDLALLAERTINYALETLARGNAVPDGTLRDALRAVDIGEKLDRGAADWGTLRSSLQRLIARSGSATGERPPEQKKEALDEEDRPSQTNGQGSQQTTSESMGQGGAAKSDAALGELQKSGARRVAPPKPPRTARRSGEGPGGASGPKPDPWRALAEKRYREVVKGDTPGVLYHALAGDAAIAAEGGRDW